MIAQFQVQTRARDDWADITRQVREVIREASIEEGVATIFIPHTTAGVTIQENADPPLKGDITKVLNRIFPWTDNYNHCEDNTAAHLKTCLMGSSAQVIFSGNEPLLGTWQNVYLCEFDGPRNRTVIVKISP